MRLEILVDSEEPKIFPLNKAKIIIGSSETCDIVLPADGISRKHVTVSIEGDRYFVTDQGSSNGSFINEERLVPGRRSEFTSFFPVRLGTNVLITLLSDDEGGSLLKDLNFPKSEAKKSSDQDSKTKMISLQDLQKAKTSGLIKKREEARAKVKISNPTKKNADSSKMKMTYIAGALIFGGSAFYNLYLNRPEAPAVEMVVAPTPTPEVVKEEPKKGPDKILPEEMPSEEMIKEAILQMKCTTTIEEKICSQIPDSNVAPSGAYESIGKLFIFTLQQKNYLATNAYFPDGTNPEKPSVFPLTAEQRINFMGMLFIYKNIPSELFKDLKGKNIFVIFFEHAQGEVKILTKIGIKGSEIENYHLKFQQVLNEKVPTTGYNDLVEFEKDLTIELVAPMTELPQINTPSNLPGPALPNPADPAEPSPAMTQTPNI